MQNHPEFDRRIGLRDADRDMLEKIAEEVVTQLGYHYEGFPHELLRPENQDTVATIIAQTAFEKGLPSLSVISDISGLGNAARWGLREPIGLNDSIAHPKILDRNAQLNQVTIHIGNLVTKKLKELLALPKGI